MFLQERQEKILTLLRQDGKVLVKELSGRFSVTEDCIHKDLASLEKQGLLKRAYGGAVAPRVNTHEGMVAQRSGVDVAAKRAIAQKALKLIEDGEVLFLDISTTNVEVAKLLVREGRRVTVVTNMVQVMEALSTPCKAELIFIGGVLNRKNNGFVGSLAVDFLSRMHFDAGFFGTVGVNVYDNAVFTYMPEDGVTKQAAVRQSRRCYLLAENRKFSADGNFRYAALDDFQGVLTEELPSREVAQKLEKYQLELF